MHKQFVLSFALPLKWHAFLIAALIGIGAFAAFQEGSPSRADVLAWTVGPGSELIPGFVVPPQARLVGEALYAPGFGRQDAPTSVQAHLFVEGNPFDVWDHLADQATSSGYTVPHSAYCEWVDQDLDPVLARTQPPTVVEPRPSGAESVSCHRRTSKAHFAHGSRIIELDLLWGPEAATMTVRIQDDLSAGFVPPLGVGNAYSANGYVDRGIPDPGSAPQSAVIDLPATQGFAPLRAGARIDQELPCLGHGAKALRVPSGALALESGPRRPILLLVDDAQATLVALADQLEREGASVMVGRAAIADSTIWELRARGADGEVCDAWSSPNGRVIALGVV